MMNIQRASIDIQAPALQIRSLGAAVQASGEGWLRMRGGDLLLTAFLFRDQDWTSHYHYCDYCDASAEPEHPPQLERSSGLGGKMKSIVKGAFCSFVMVLVADHSAHAGRLREGLAGFNRGDYAAAASPLWLRAERGDSRAQTRLCFMYTYGRGVPQSDAEAAGWCHRAANQGNSEAQYMLGLLYNKGHGVPEDFVEAYKWLDLAAARASGPKREYPYRIRDAVATKMSPAQIARAQALAVAWRPMPELRGSALIEGRCASHENCLDP
jgi:uncharacterized protein